MTKMEKQIFADHEAAGSHWLLTVRHPGVQDLALVLARVREIAGDLPPSVTLWEKAYRQLYAEGQVSLVTEKMKVPEVKVRSHLSLDEYHKMPKSQVARLYMSSREFKADVDDLIRRKLI
jgi:hypothetical protein